MSDIELVIKIPKEQYSLIMQSHRDGVARFVDKEALMYAIKNSALFDSEGLKNDMKALNCGYPYGLDYLLKCLKKRLGITIAESEGEV